MARAPSKHKKFLDDYLGMDKTGLNYGSLEDAEDDKVVEAYELHHTKEAEEGGKGLETHMMAELHNTVKEMMGDKTNFQHIEGERERRKEAANFVDELMKFSIEKYYVHTGMSEADAKSRVDAIMEDPRMATAWGNRLWSKLGGREGFIDQLMDFDGNLRDFLHPDNADMYKQLYHPVVQETNPHKTRKDKLYSEVRRRERAEAVDKYVLKQIKDAIGDDADKFEIYAGADRQALMRLSMDLKRGEPLSKKMIKEFEIRYETKLFSKVHDRYKKGK